MISMLIQPSFTTDFLPASHLCLWAIRICDNCVSIHLSRPGCQRLRYCLYSWNCSNQPNLQLSLTHLEKKVSKLRGAKEHQIYILVCCWIILNHNCFYQSNHASIWLISGSLDCLYSLGCHIHNFWFLVPCYLHVQAAHIFTVSLLVYAETVS